MFVYAICLLQKNNCQRLCPTKLHPAIREECKESSKCAALAKHFEHCQEKVHAGQGFKHEDCVEELCVFFLRFFNFSNMPLDVSAESVSSQSTYSFVSVTYNFPYLVQYVTSLLRL